MVIMYNVFFFEHPLCGLGQLVPGVDIIKVKDLFINLNVVKHLKAIYFCKPCVEYYALLIHGGGQLGQLTSNPCYLQKNSYLLQ